MAVPRSVLDPAGASVVVQPVRAADDQTVKARLAFAAREIHRNPLTLFGLCVVVALVLLAIFAPLVAPYDPIAIDLRGRLQPPTWTHWMGTDEVGRDILSRVVYGARVSLQTGLIVVGVAGTIGGLLGAACGYIRGLLDEVVMRTLDVVMAFPSLILALAIAAMLGPSLVNAVIALAVVQIPRYTRLARGEALQLRELQFVLAARALGASHARVVLRHIIPNSLSSLIVMATLGFGQVILYAASLSFIGLGVQPPTPEWGAMVSIGRKYVQEQWWYSTFPGLAIFVVVVAFNVFGDGLRDILDPRWRRRG